MRTSPTKRIASPARIVTNKCLRAAIGVGVCFIMSLSVLWSIAAGPSYAGEVYDPAGEIERIRADIKSRGYSWTAGETSMNSIPPAERRKYLGLKVPPGTRPFAGPPAVPGRIAPRELPAVWDWREQGGVTPVKYQGQCGSCWIFCTVGAFESLLLIETGVEHDLSEQQILVCNKDGYGCRGGWMRSAYNVLMSPGAVSEECMPYMACDTLPCTQDSCEVVDHLDCYAEIPNDINILKQKVYEHPVSTGLTIFDDFFSYTGGCYEHDGSMECDHCVMIVGWADTACGGEGAWICKNSWGENWGIDGYFYIKYGSCGIGGWSHEIFYGGTAVHEWSDVTTGPLGETGWGRGLAWVDYDDDGDLDIFVTNRTTSDHLFRNDDLTAGGFVDATPVVLADTSDNRAAAWGDYDADGDLDLYVSTWGPNKLYRNDSGGTFVNVTTAPLDDSSIGNTASWADYDNDGDLDLYLVNNGPNRLFRNDGAEGFTDVTQGALGDTCLGMGMAWADYDDDGDLDLYIANRQGPNLLLKNVGDDEFIDATTPEVAVPEQSGGAAWADYDNDGDLDLFVTTDGPDRLFRNDGGYFADVSSAIAEFRGAGRGVAWFDYDYDGDLDVYVANSDGSNGLWTNDGTGGFDSWVCGNQVLDDEDSGFGTAWADYDQDGDLDLYLVNNGSNRLYRNDMEPGNHWLEVKLTGVTSNVFGLG
ncbi:MAG: FG-GAP-like repeat-containing protein, partial [bacterium]